MQDSVNIWKFLFEKMPQKPEKSTDFSADIETCETEQEIMSKSPKILKKNQII